MLDPNDFVYLPSLVFKELLAGHKVHVTGGLYEDFVDADDFKNKKSVLVGKFGEIIPVRGSDYTHIATRQPPPWALKLFHECIWTAKEMEQWKIPEKAR